MDMRKIIEKESETAKDLADEIVLSAGLDRSVIDILNSSSGEFYFLLISEFFLLWILKYVRINVILKGRNFCDD
jgi:hypothetical protein